ncbi:MAG: hypothetical protein MK101_00280 [Phycisphaerales bacterium]|nr:hypothetical protein [Phycisphaerales bacterium]
MIDKREECLMRSICMPIALMIWMVSHAHGTPMLIDLGDAYLLDAASGRVFCRAQGEGRRGA